MYSGLTLFRRGAIVTTFIVCYALTSFISGYVSGGMYSRSGGMLYPSLLQAARNISNNIPPLTHFQSSLMLVCSGKHWIKCMILTASLFPFLCFGIGFVLNTIAIFYGSLAAIPFGTMVVVFVIWGFISFPLALLGTVVGRNWSGAPNNPCRVKTIPRPIPEKKWYLTPSVVSLMGGLLPFGSIFIEMYFVFTSFWNYKVKISCNVERAKLTVHFLMAILCLVTGILCVRVYAACLFDSSCGDRLCDDRGNILLAECGKLSLAMDIVLLSCFDRGLRLLILNLLLLRKDKDVWVFPDQLLLRIHLDVLSWPRHPLR